MILFLDTSDLNKIRFALISDNSVKSQTLKIPYEENFKTLEHLDKFLKSNGLLPTNYYLLTSIVISSGPGSFTGLRVGASISQALKLALNIPVTVVKKNKIPKNLKKLASITASKKLDLDYGRPAVY